MHFITRVTPIDSTDGKTHKTTEKQPQLFSLSFKVKIMPLVIYGLRGGHIHTHILWQNESDLKKPGAAACGQHAPGLKNYAT